MFAHKVTLLVACIYLQKVYAFNEMTNHVDIHEVNAGETVVLHCSSSDKSHNFMFWHFIKNSIVIGPRNEFNNNKYQYEVLTGNLTIRGVTSKETGLYSCVSDGVTKRDILVNSVKLHIKSDEHEAQHLHYENNNAGSNLWKVCAILGSILVFLVLVGVFLHIYHKRSGKPKYFDIVVNNDEEEEEDSTEELFTRQPSTSTAKPKVTTDRNNATDNFEKVYTAINVNNI